MPKTTSKKPTSPPRTSTEPPAKTEGPDVGKLINSANQAYEDGNYDSAIGAYKKALQADPQEHPTAQAGLDQSRTGQEGGTARLDWTKFERAKKAEQTLSH